MGHSSLLLIFADYFFGILRNRGAPDLSNRTAFMTLLQPDVAVLQQEEPARRSVQAPILLRTLHAGRQWTVSKAKLVMPSSQHSGGSCQSVSESTSLMSHHNGQTIQEGPCGSPCHSSFILLSLPVSRCRYKCCMNKCCVDTLNAEWFISCNEMRLASYSSCHVWVLACLV